MNARTGAAYTTLLVLLSGTLIASLAVESLEPDVLEAPLESISTDLAGWKLLKKEKLPAGQLKALRPTTYLARIYGKNDRNLAVFVAYFGMQRAGETMHSPRQCLPGAGWEIADMGSADLIVNGQHMRINRHLIQNAGSRMLVLYWYQSRDRVIADEYLGKVLRFRDTLLTGRTGGSLVRIISADHDDPLQETLHAAGALMSEVQRCLGR